MNFQEISLNRKIWLAIAIILILAAWWGASNITDGLDVQEFDQSGIPLRFITPESGDNLPGIIIAHGFGGSQQLMLGYGYAFANAGYGVMLLDFAGHAANANPISEGYENLQEDLDAAYQALIAQPNVNPDKIALLGHSMGSGAVMRAGIANPERYSAVVAISPIEADVTETEPPNLMLQAGSLEGQFVENAQQLLVDSGGTNDDFQGKLARRFEEIPNVEHITILFSPRSRDLAIEWVNQTVGAEGANTYSDTRIIWFGLHLVGWLILAVAAAPFINTAESTAKAKGWRNWLGNIVSPFIAIGMLALFNLVFDVSEFLGLLVGGGLAIWFLVMGITWMAVGFKPSAPSRSSYLWGFLMFAIMWVALGLMAQFTWMSWFINLPRLLIWPLIALACLPWKLASAYALQNSSNWNKVGFWAVQSVVLVAALFATAIWVPGMFVVMLVAPILPIVLGVEGIIGAQFKDPWAYAIGSALYVGWMIASFFPIA